MIEQNTNNFVEISKETFYAPSFKNGKNIGPLFNLSRLWTHKYPDSNISLTCSNNVLLKYSFLRFLTSMITEGYPGFDELLVWPKVQFEGGKEEWNLSNFLKSPYEIDMLRTCLMLKYPTQDTDVNVAKSDFLGARNFLYLVANLRNPLCGMGYYPPEELEQYNQDMNSFKYSKVLQLSERMAREISHSINTSKSKGSFEQDKRIFAVEYSKLITQLQPFMPSTFELCKRSLENVI
jgi:hypothetical protein